MSYGTVSIDWLFSPFTSSSFFCILTETAFPAIGGGEVPKQPKFQISF